VKNPTHAPKEQYLYSFKCPQLGRKGERESGMERIGGQRKEENGRKERGKEGGHISM
jgi:hypothetical protein